ncbi:MAG: AAA family ATPase [Bosea sp.]|uniref:AAA family ATPase n=1 Tax=Bosea sp. (in: a-proteobacteria) TaxID=1871050 RepID=UPI00238B2DF7|nr:AAA family ATPase [Bosea sp. (in: a-proteobacteria)]MCP4732876.1 AAA family ATPase [Bosea sp. (in: a-proteobacteria)]
MAKTNERLFVLTGGPGAGKTTLLAALAAAGHAMAPEAGRAIIRDQLAIDGPALPWRDRALFAELMLNFDLRSFHEAQATEAPVFFDRGVPDSIGYLRLCGLPVPEHFDRAARAFRYARIVFAAPPWREIYEQDAERKQDFAEAKRTYAAVTAAYRELGYDLVELPRADVDTRAAFVLDRVRASLPIGQEPR